jgi:[acyl-carrier-protein] S-malonyltransferase
MKTCFLFPGQGAQYPGMGKDLWENSSKVKEIFECAADSTGMDIQKLLFEGTEEELKSTDKTQIAITVVNLSAAALLNERGIGCDGAAGFSLGEYSALTEAGVIALEDVFPLVKARGDVMEETAKGLDTGSGAPGMAAVIGLGYDDLKAVIADNGIDGVYLANYNSPVQVVLSGTADGLTAAEEPCKAAGAKRYIRLKVSAPFHSPLLEQAQIKFTEHLDKCTFSDPSIPVYTNVTGQEVASGEEAKKRCIEQIVSTVLWVDEEKQLLADGFARCFEVGPGKVLSGLWKSVGGDIVCQPAGTFEQIESVSQ